ncbi:MAG: hypothetical protein L0216_20025 [Planctomycetales bacterium]|nr:hypothetical protein [Planctomycetales bacterium]
MSAPGPMASEEFHGRMGAVHDHFEGGRHDESLREARGLKALLLDAEAVDPIQLGWARFYEFKSLHALERWEEAWHLIESNERVPWIVSSVNAAWMFSVGSEVAARVGNAEGVVKWGGKCLDLRTQLGDVLAAGQCAGTVCTLLGWVDRQDLNGPFAERLIAIGKQSGAEMAVLHGVERLMDNFAKGRSDDVARRVREEIPAIRAMESGEFADEARVVRERYDKLFGDSAAAGGSS